MRQIVPPINLVQKILGQPKWTEGTPYRLTTHCVQLEQPEGVLLYHTLTGELLLLEKEEAAMLENLHSCIPSFLAELVSRRFLVPEWADDMGTADQVRQIAERFRKEKTTVTAFTAYRIFTTTACNARCFYCYEGRWEKSTMTEQTALDAAKYIMAHCGGKPVHIEWFGGEPLVNTHVIDVITGFLRQRGMEFHSTMTSNGYLFDEALVRRVRDDWNLKEVQITLDGTEAVYNRRKAYVNPEGSPYQRVLKNIGLLLDAGIRVKVRLNMDQDNEGDLYALVDELAERFKGKSGFSIYCEALYENLGANPKRYTENECRCCAKNLRSMQTYIEKKGVTFREPLRRRFIVNACVGDNSETTAIMPDGRLCLCESSRDDGIWGSIYSDEVDEEVRRQWRERKPAEEVCKSCAVYPQCLRLKKCPNWLENCSPIEQARRENTVHRAVLTAYEDWKAGGAIDI